MKKTIFIALLMIFSLGASTAFAGKSDLKSKSDKSTVLTKSENNLSALEVNRLTTRVEEIRDMDKTNMTVSEKRELRKESRSIKENVRRDGGGYIYIGGGTLLLILLIILLL
ncbi:MAG TPA: hypothetical protein DCR40_19520 [Prolixibacteraceae bacterium]|nr:hypothetical protein [Prolixibacteraceae bacterium]